MPLYEYHCQKCGGQFEKMARLAEVDLTPECPKCHSRETQKEISVFATTGSNVASSFSGSSSGGCGSSGRFT